MKRRSLLVKIVLMFAGVLVFLGFVVSISIWKLSKNAAATQVNKDVQHGSLGVRSYIEQARKEVRLQAILVAQEPVLKAIIANHHDTETLKDELMVFRSQVNADGLVFFDRDGKSEVKLGDYPSETNLSNSTLDSLLDENKDVRDGYETTKDSLLLSTTVPIKIGQLPLGFVTAYRRIDNAVANDLGGSLGIEVAFQYNGKVVATSIPGFHKFNSRPGAFSATIDGKHYGAQSFPVSEKGTNQKLNVVVMRSDDDATAAYRQLFGVFMVLLPIALAMAIGLSWIFTRGLVSNLRSVVAAAEELSAGRWPEKLEVSSKDEVGILQRVFNSTVDSLRQAQDRLLAMIDLDPLTELHNHRYFKEAMTSEVERSKASGENLALVLIDLDGFKEFNEANGLAAGDAVLKGLAAIVQENAETYHRTARFSGNVFAILMPESDIVAAEHCAENIRLQVKGQLPGLTVSLGCAQFGVNTQRAEGLMMAAELALARSKQLGRDRVCRFDSVPGAEGDADPYQLYKLTQDASLATIQALAAAVDAKDPYTKGHSVRVAEYARDLARYVGLSEPIQELTYRTGTLHDVGKIGVPDSILKKPGRLEEDERAIMETHPVLGELIVRKAPQLEDTVPGVRNHHEAWNGKGYPDGLSGDEIPLIARLLAIADTYDAMTSDRPYRKGLAVEIALAESRKGAGTQFDPDLAVPFVTMMEARFEEPMAA